MASLIIDLSGMGGLVERHQGDLTDTTATPNARYFGGDTKYADGVFDPMKKLGFLSPANANFLSLTGDQITNYVTAFAYDDSLSVLFIAEEGNLIHELIGVSDTALYNYVTLTDGYSIKDMVMYEVNNQKSIVYAVDTNTELIEAPENSAANAGGMYLGFKTLNIEEGATVLEKDIKSAYPSTDLYSVSLRDSATAVTFPNYRRVAQEFDGGDVYGRSISGVYLSLRRAAGTGSGITIKVSIQSPATASTGAFTGRGAWSNAVTDYAVNDTVTNASVTYQCIQAHDAAATANDEPGVGSVWENYWNVFGAPSGTVLASGTLAFDEVSELAESGEKRFYIGFDTALTGLGNGNYWLVIEEEGSNMTASDSMGILGTSNGTGLYDGYKYKGFMDAGADFWRDAVDFNGAGDIDTMDFRFVMNQDDNWTANTGSTTNSMILGSIGEDTGQNTFLLPAENGLLYWFVGNNVHAINGSITGGGTGTLTENVLVFPSYLSVFGAAETRSRMFIAVQSADIDSPSTRNFVSDNIGVFTWDRRSQILTSTDFYKAPGAKAVKGIFTSSTGDVLIVTIGNEGFSEIRGISGNQYAVIQTFEADGYPSTRRSITQIGDMTVWVGRNGIIYAYGQLARGESMSLYKIGDAASVLGDNIRPGAIFAGNDEATRRIGLLIGASFTQ